MPAADSTLYLLKLGEIALLEEEKLAEAEALLNEAFQSAARTLLQIAVALDELERRRRPPQEPRAIRTTRPPTTAGRPATPRLAPPPLAADTSPTVKS